MASVTDLDSALDALLHFSGRRSRGHSAIETMAALLDHLGHPERTYKLVHVAGTSGKTSTAYLIRALLEKAGFRTGLTVSPHVVAVNERVQVGGLPVPEERFVAYVREFLPLASSLGRELTYFEMGVGLALWVFAQEGVEYGIVEVGIGGTRDATNALQHPRKLCVVTAVGLDHTDLLGDSVDAIATHKAGIVGEGNTVVVVDQDEVVVEVVRDRAREVGGQVVVVTPPAGARYQERNLALARGAVGILGGRDGFDVPVVDARLETPPARYERFASGGRLLVLDGAHNPQKMAGLVESLRADGLTDVAVLATLLQAPDTKLAATLAVLAPVVSHLIVPEYALGDGDKVKQSFPAGLVVEQARALGISAELVGTPAEGLERLWARTENGLVVTGSLYLASLVRPLVIAHFSEPVASLRAGPPTSHP
jgi:dihydrofolate synthase/folylpolyglutamate synthase